MKMILRYITFGVAALQVNAAIAGNFAPAPKVKTAATAPTVEDWNRIAMDNLLVGSKPKDPVKDLVMNATGPFYTKADIERLAQAKTADDQSRMMLKGQVISIDTRDQDACQAIQDELLNNKSLKAMNDVKGLCVVDNQKPIATVTVLSESSEVQWKKEINIKKYTSTEKNIVTATRNVALAALGVAGILYMMPESFTNWKKDEMKNLGKKWKENIKAGPHRDSDDWMINYIGHPYSGAAYYQVARSEGMSAMQSFGYSVVMSTFFWEFGVEAFAERPSIQDIFSTPIIGSILGELFYRVEQRIIANDGYLLGSQKLGAFAMLVMNPMGALSEKINKLIGSKVIQDAKAQMVVRKAPATGSEIQRGNIWGVELQFRF